MRIVTATLMATAILCGCAQAGAPAPKPIPDAEPEVTLQVAAVLAQLADGVPPSAPMTDKAKAALGPAELREMAAALRPCSKPPALELLARTTKGEDRNYLYRALCADTPLLVEITFNKAANIDRLAVQPEPR